MTKSTPPASDQTSEIIPAGGAPSRGGIRVASPKRNVGDEPPSAVSAPQGAEVPFPEAISLSTGNSRSLDLSRAQCVLH